ncbi:hypothetical protein R84B8_00322 [Treponema sp. R8-4-B8]
MKKILLICLLAAIWAFQASAQQNLVWDIQFLKGNKQEIIPYSQTITAESGQGLYVVIIPTSDCYCYVLSQNSERKMAVLHDQNVKGGDEINLNLLPEDSSPDTKTFYVIMSLARQTKLEELIKNYKSNPDSIRHINNLHGEIAKLQDTASGLGEPSSVIIASGGTTRGSSQEYATRFSTKNMYVRTITIRTAQAAN